MTPHLRWMVRRDMSQVLAIENACFPDPWSEDDFLRCLQQRNVIGMVAERDDVILGAMVYELHKDRLHVLNFAVHPEYRRCGVGRAMVAKLQSKLSRVRRCFVSLDVRETNLAAQLFFRSCGFSCVGIKHGFYDECDESAYLMELPFQSSELVGARR